MLDLRGSLPGVLLSLLAACASSTERVSNAPPVLDPPADKATSAPVPMPEVPWGRVVEPALLPAPAHARARSAALTEAIEALPVIARIDDLAPTPFVLRGNLSERRAAEMASMGRYVISDVARRFVGAPDDGSALDAVDVCMFEDDDSYSAFADLTGDRDTLMGYYLPRQRLIAANLGRSVGNLRHELVHPLVGDDFARRRQVLPAWFNEGLGSLYGTSRVHPDRVSFLVNYRLRHVRDAMRARRLPSLEDMARSGRDELYGRQGMTYYGTARYLLLFLESSGQLESFYRALRDSDQSAERQLELLEERVDHGRFVSWTRRLRKGQTAPQPR